MTYRKNRPGFRHCNKCKSEFALTPENFPLDKNRKSGFGYQCKPCANEISRLRGDSRKGRWSAMTTEQKAKKYEIGRKYARGAGRAIVKVASYRSIDKNKGWLCDLTADWFRANIENKSCIYCGDATISIGCDRILNNLGHSKNNVVPCCPDCNVTRMGHYTHEEMLLIGKTIKKIKKIRRTI